MKVAHEMEDLENLDPTEYLREKEEYEDKRDEFMRKHLRRAWPKRVIRILGVIQLLISLAILGVDLPIILMFAPRWQVFAGCWTFIFGFIACVYTLHSTRKLTWRKLKWAVVFNIIAGLAAGIMVAFDILALVNPYICVAVGGCNYLYYTYTAANSFYMGEVILGIALLLTAFVFLILFIKYGIGGSTLFEDIQNGAVTAPFNSIAPPHGTIPVPQNPTAGPGVSKGRPPPPPQLPQRYMPRYPPPGPGVMMNGPHGPMMMSGPPGSMPQYPPPGPGVMMAGPRGPMMMPGPPGSMMMPGPRGPMQGYYRQPVPYPPTAYQN